MLTWEINKENTWLQYGVCAFPQSSAKVTREWVSTTFTLTRFSDENPDMLLYTAQIPLKSSSAI